MKPNAAVESVAEPIAAALKYSQVEPYWQTMRPSTVAGPIGGPEPPNR